MSLVAICCAYCKKTAYQKQGHVNRAISNDAPLYCNRACAGMARRRKIVITPEQAKAEKKAYDAARRERLRDVIKEKKRIAYQLNFDREKEAAYRKANMHKHIEYCRRPEYREWKSRYDRKHQAEKKFGEFATAALLLRDLEDEICSQATRYEIALTNGLLNKAQQRRRAL